MIHTNSKKYKNSFLNNKYPFIKIYYISLLYTRRNNNWSTKLYVWNADPSHINSILQ